MATAPQEGRLQAICAELTARGLIESRTNYAIYVDGSWACSANMEPLMPALVPVIEKSIEEIGAGKANVCDKQGQPIDTWKKLANAGHYELQTMVANMMHTIRKLEGEYGPRSQKPEIPDWFPEFKIPPNVVQRKQKKEEPIPTTEQYREEKYRGRMQLLNEKELSLVIKAILNLYRNDPIKLETLKANTLSYLDSAAPSLQLPMVMRAYFDAYGNAACQAPQEAAKSPTASFEDGAGPSRLSSDSETIAAGVDRDWVLSHDADSGLQLPEWALGDSPLSGTEKRLFSSGSEEAFRFEAGAGSTDVSDSDLGSDGFEGFLGAIFAQAAEVDTAEILDGGVSLTEGEHWQLAGEVGIDGFGDEESEGGEDEKEDDENTDEGGPDHGDSDDDKGDDQDDPPADGACGGSSAGQSEGSSGDENGGSGSSGGSDSGYRFNPDMQNWGGWDGFDQLNRLALSGNRYLPVSMAVHSCGSQSLERAAVAGGGGMLDKSQESQSRPILTKAEAWALLRSMLEIADNRMAAQRGGSQSSAESKAKFTVREFVAEERQRHAQKATEKMDTCLLKVEPQASSRCSQDDRSGEPDNAVNSYNATAPEDKVSKRQREELAEKVCALGAGEEAQVVEASVAADEERLARDRTAAIEAQLAIDEQELYRTGRQELNERIRQQWATDQEAAMQQKRAELDASLTIAFEKERRDCKGSMRVEMETKLQAKRGALEAEFEKKRQIDGSDCGGNGGVKASSRAGENPSEAQKLEAERAQMVTRIGVLIAKEEEGLPKEQRATVSRTTKRTLSEGEESTGGNENEGLDAALREGLSTESMEEELAQGRAMKAALADVNGPAQLSQIEEQFRKLLAGEDTPTRAELEGEKEQRVAESKGDVELLVESKRLKPEEDTANAKETSEGDQPIADFSSMPRSVLPEYASTGDLLQTVGSGHADLKQPRAWVGDPLLEERLALEIVLCKLQQPSLPRTAGLKDPLSTKRPPILMATIPRKPSEGEQMTNKVLTEHLQADSLNSTQKVSSIYPTRKISVTPSWKEDEDGKKESSQFRGVVAQPHGKWGAQIYDKHTRLWLGTYKSEREAARAHDRAAVKIQGIDAKTNFWSTAADNDLKEGAFISLLDKDQLIEMLQKHTFEEEIARSGWVVDASTTLREPFKAIEEPLRKRQFLFDKVLTPSDVGKLNRLVLPRDHAGRFFPLDLEQASVGHTLQFEDESGKFWRFRYSYWSSSQSYVLTKGWSRFVKEKTLLSGDLISFHQGDAGQLYIGYTKAQDVEGGLPSQLSAPSDVPTALSKAVEPTPCAQNACLPEWPGSLRSSLLGPASGLLLFGVPQTQSPRAPDYDSTRLGPLKTVTTIASPKRRFAEAFEPVCSGSEGAAERAPTVRRISREKEAAGNWASSGPWGI